MFLFHKNMWTYTKPNTTFPCISQIGTTNKRREAKLKGLPIFALSFIFQAPWGVLLHLLSILFQHRQTIHDLFYGQIIRFLVHILLPQDFKIRLQSYFSFLCGAKVGWAAKKKIAFHVSYGDIADRKTFFFHNF